jgi:hypothetical protein
MVAAMSRETLPCREAAITIDQLTFAVERGRRLRKEEREKRSFFSLSSFLIQVIRRPAAAVL